MRRNVKAAMGGLPLVLSLLLTVLADHAWGQLRLYGKVDPNTGDPQPKLVFDVNFQIADNVAPNIVFTSDGTRGYVAYAGSGTILGFSTANGAITARIATGGKPSASTPLADGRTIAVVSVQDNRVFLVDIEADTVAATYTFENAEFGFGSVVTVSPDGSTGYVSSTGTSEVIKFSISDGRELARLGGLGAPCRITVSPDGSTLMVVDTIRETLVFVNAASLTIKATMTGATGTSVNFTISSKAVLAQDGDTGIITSADVNGIYGSDTVYLFRTSTGERLNSTTVGAEPIFTGLTPDGKYYVILCSTSLWKISTTDFSSKKEMQTPGSQSVVGSNVLFSSDSRYAYYTASSEDMVYQHDLELDLVVGQTAVGDPGLKGNDLVCSVGLTPDGKSIAVVDFAINVLNLVERVSSINGATFVSSPSRFTGVSLVNLAPGSNKITFKALDIYGQLLTGTGVTNPVDYDLSQNQQVSLTVGEIFDFDATKEQVGWLSILTSSPQTVGYLSIGDTSLNRLDAVPLFSKPLTEWIVPDIAKGSGISVELNIVNPDYVQTTYDITRYDQSGTSAEQKTGLIGYPTNRTNQTLLTLFPTMADGTTGHLRIKTPGNLLNTVLTQTDSALGALNGIQVSDFAGIKALYSPQFVVGYGYKTILNVINAGSAAADITIILHSSNGSTIGLPHHATLAANAQLKNDLAVIFQGDSAVSNVTGWLEVQSSQDKVVGTITFTRPDGRFVTTFELLGVPSRDFIFPVLAQTDVYQTGIAMLNANPEPATVTLEVWSVGGTMSGSTTVTLGAKSQEAVYLNHYFPNMGHVLKGSIRIHSTGSLFGLALIHDQVFTFMTAIPSFPLP
jgi:hypothetical protein